MLYLYINIELQRIIFLYVFDINSNMDLSIANSMNPNIIHFNMEQIMLFRYVPQNNAQESELKKIMEGHIKHGENKGRSPLVAVDVLPVIFKERIPHVPIGLFDKTKMTYRGEKERICGAVMCGGHVENGGYAKPGELPAEGDLTIYDAAKKELEEELHITKFDEEYPLKQVGLFDYTASDPRNRIITNLFTGLALEEPQISDEIQKVRLISVEDLKAAIDKNLIEIDGKEYEFVLGHRYKIRCLMLTEYFKQCASVKEIA